jgi:hypothetical protein
VPARWDCSGRPGLCADGDFAFRSSGGHRYPQNALCEDRFAQTRRRRLGARRGDRSRCGSLVHRHLCTERSRLDAGAPSWTSTHAAGTASEEGPALHDGDGAETRSARVVDEGAQLEHGGLARLAARGAAALAAPRNALRERSSRRRERLGDRDAQAHEPIERLPVNRRCVVGFAWNRRSMRCAVRERSRTSARECAAAARGGRAVSRSQRGGGSRAPRRPLPERDGPGVEGRGRPLRGPARGPVEGRVRPAARPSAIVPLQCAF